MNYELMKILAKDGLLPKSLFKDGISICPSCQYGKSKKRKRQKGQIIKKKITKPGHLIHMDQEESSTPGRP